MKSGFENANFPRVLSNITYRISEILHFMDCVEASFKKKKNPDVVQCRFLGKVFLV